MLFAKRYLIALLLSLESFGGSWRIPSSALGDESYFLGKYIGEVEESLQVIWHVVHSWKNREQTEERERKLMDIVHLSK